MNRETTKLVWPFSSQLPSDANKPSHVPHSLTDLPASENEKHPTASQDFRSSTVLQAGVVPKAEFFIQSASSQIYMQSWNIIFITRLHNAGMLGDKATKFAHPPHNTYIIYTLDFG